MIKVSKVAVQSCLEVLFWLVASTLSSQTGPPNFIILNINIEDFNKWVVYNTTI